MSDGKPLADPSQEPLASPPGVRLGAPLLAGGTANLEGRIDLRLIQRDGRVTGVDIRSTRPQLARKLMAGRTPEEAADLAGLVFSLCGQAQRAAAQAACAAAQGKGTETADATPVLMELAREHAWRLLLDWPQEAGQAPDMASLLALRQATPENFTGVLEGLLAEKLLGEPPYAWLARDLDGLDAWARQGATLPARLFSTLGNGPDLGISQAPLLPELQAWTQETATALAHQALDDPAYCATPDWRGAPAETGAIARAHGQPLVSEWIAHRGRGMGARLLARLHELADLPDQMRTGGNRTIRAWSIAEGMARQVGVAGVETSRGLLFHVASLHDGKVADYRILAPTEWNFHPAGPLAQALTGMEARSEPVRLVSRSLDPCVAFGVEFIDAGASDA